MRPLVFGVCILLAWQAADATTTLLYVNRCSDGCSFVPGLPDDAVANVTPLVSAPSTLSAFAHGDAVFDATVACVAAGVEAYDLEVTTVDPSPAPHLEIVMAGWPQEAGVSETTASSTRQQCTYLPNSISMVYANREEPDAGRLCRHALLGLGFAAGLEYLFHCPDVMSLLGSCGTDKAFRDNDSACGITFARPCECTSTATRNSHAVMLSVFGAAPLFRDGFEQAP